MTALRNQIAGVGGFDVLAMRVGSWRSVKLREMGWGREYEIAAGCDYAEVRRRAGWGRNEGMEGWRVGGMGLGGWLVGWFIRCAEAGRDWELEM
jgi:hypothetical protein